MTKIERAALFAMFGGRCAYCGQSLLAKGWHADHVEPVVRKLKYVFNEAKGYGEMKPAGGYHRPENDTLANLLPSCAPCNIDKGASGLESFRKGIEYKITVLRNNNANFRHLERYGMISIVRPRIVFYFESFLGGDASPVISKEVS